MQQKQTYVQLQRKVDNFTRINGAEAHGAFFKMHITLPGITVGDIGTKFGNGAYNSMDNKTLGTCV